MGGIKLKNLEEKPIIEEKIIEQKKAEPEVKTKPKVMRRPKNKDASILVEDASKTTEHTKHYLLNNGTAKTVVSGQEINYFDANTKEWKEVDSTFEDKGDVYERNLKFPFVSFSLLICLKLKMAKRFKFQIRAKSFRGNT